MRILYVSQYFPPEVNAPAQRTMDFARQWQSAGHDVTVVTGFPNHPAGVVYDGYKVKPIQREVIDGVKVIRTYLYPAPNKRIRGRCANYASFMLSAALIGGHAAGDVDVVIASCPQLLVGVAGWFISAAKRVPFVLEVRDMWPEALAAVNADLPGWFCSSLGGVAKFLYKHAAKVITVTHGATEAIARDYGIPMDKLEMIPSGIRTDYMKPMDPPKEIRQAFGNGDSIIVSYIGTHGMAQNLITVLEAAHQLSNEKRIKFVLIGDGAEKEDLIKTKSDLGIENVYFVDQLPQEEVLRYVAASDICLAPLRKAELFTKTIPSKLYEIMACARPIVLGVDGEARELIENAGAGVYVEPENSSELAAAVLKLASDSETRLAYGRRGRAFVTANYDKKMLAAKYLDLLCSLKSRK